MEELDLKELLQVFWEKKVQIILITAIFFTIGLIYTVGFITPEYESVTRLLLATNSSSQTPGTDSITTTDVTLNSGLVSTYSTLVKTDKIMRKVVSNLGIDKEENELKKNTTVSSVTGTQLIDIKVKDLDPALAAKLTNEIAKVFIETVTEYYGIENVHIVDEAEVPQGPCNINHTRDIIIFTFIGLVVSAMYVIILNMLDTTVKSEEDIEKTTGVTILASIPICDGIDDVNKKKSGRGGKR